MYATVFVPNFALQSALRAEPENAATAVALIGEAEGSAAPFIREINLVAEASGVAVGMSLPQALARCAGLVLRRACASQEAIGTTAVLQSAERASPYLEHTAPGCCTLDLRRHGELDHAAWAHDLVADLAKLGLCAQVGIASTPDAALQAAQLGKPVLSTADSLQSLAQLPVPVLGPSAQILDVLSDWGVERVADLRALERQEVAERLGNEGLELWDRAAGGATRPLRLVRAAEIYEEIVEFEGCGVETLEPVLFRLRRCLEQLSLRLRAGFLLVGTVELILYLDDRSALNRAIHIPSPTCEVDVLFRVLSTYLDTVRTDSQVMGFRVRAEPSTPRDHQAHLWETSLRDPNAFSETLARLAGVVGAAHVGTPRRLFTHRPDRFRLEEPLLEHSDGPTPRHHCRFASEGTALDSFALPPLGLSLRRYRPPFRVQVESERNKPLAVRGGKIAGEICASAGPWRLDGDWWDERSAWRWEEWDVQFARGGLYRLANHREVNWWLLGLYD